MFVHSVRASLNSASIVATADDFRHWWSANADLNGAATVNIEELRNRQNELNDQCQVVIAHAEAEKRDLTKDEKGQIENATKEFESLEEEIQLKERTMNQQSHLAKSTGRKTEPEPTNRLPDDVPVDVPPAKANGKPNAPANVWKAPQRTTYDRTAGFRSLGEFANAVFKACQRGGQMDNRLEYILNATPSTYGQESVGADGGFAVPPDFRTAIMETVLGEESLLSRTDQINVAGNTFTQPIDETTPWGTTGIRAYWGGEGDLKTQSKPVLGERTIKLNKLYALVPMTDELLEDAPAMDAYLRRKAPEKIAFEASLAVLQGNGVGKPLGILNSPALVSVAKESGQVADTLIGSNVIKMYSRMYAPSRSRAVWLVNQDVEPHLMKLSVPGTDNTGNAVTGWGTMVYMPPGGLNASPYGSLLGRPVIPTQAAETLGDKGDIFFADLTQYLTILKSGTNPKVDVSMHLWFDYDITAFRFVLRVGGIPWWSAPIASRDGSATYSPFVTLDERA